MPPTLPTLTRGDDVLSSPRRPVKKFVIPTLGILSVLLFLYVAIGPLHASQAQNNAVTVAHTSATVDESCNKTYYSRDGNPFQLCPSAYPGGGNCVWWAWEQWHLLGYDLPLNWGNAADWVVDAERVGLSIGTEPRVGSIAVFPRADGVWAYGAEGHVAFVTSVSSNGSLFNVTYQNYGDPKPMYVGLNYSVDVINQPHFQRNELRFIYFPTTINPSRFAQLPGLNGNYLAGLQVANQQMTNNAATIGASRPTLGLPSGSGSSEQEFNADFTGNGLSDLLLYNRQQGSLSVVALTSHKHATSRILPNRQAYTRYSPSAPTTIQQVILSDAITSSTGWGTNLDIRIGDFTGTGKSDILLYDRTNGTMQMLTLSPELTIEKHVSLAGWGPNWELYPGRFDGQRTGLFMYNRFADASIPAALSTSASEGSSIQQWQMTGRTANAVVLQHF